MELIDSIVWSDSLGTDSAVFTIANEFVNRWLEDGVVSFMIRSDSAEEWMMLGDFTQRTWYAATLQSGNGALAPRLSFTIVPEPASLVLALGPLLWVATTRPASRSE